LINKEPALDQSYKYMAPHALPVGKTNTWLSPCAQINWTNERPEA
jgi:hypothetical protein